VFTGKATAAALGWARLTDDELLEALPATAQAVENADAELRKHVGLLRDRGVSWERIAAALGVSRQSAWERFSNES
jgi:ATP-dependent Clp protease ATP-binding subunit ClpX